VIYLRSSPKTCSGRLRHDVKRPLLQVADPLGRLRELHERAIRCTARRRTTWSRPGGLRVAMLVNIIVMQLELAGRSPGTRRSTAPGGAGRSA
jgi:shikimate kinase